MKSSNQYFKSKSKYVKSNIKKTGGQSYQQKERRPKKEIKQECNFSTIHPKKFKKQKSRRQQQRFYKRKIKKTKKEFEDFLQKEQQKENNKTASIINTIDKRFQNFYGFAVSFKVSPKKNASIALGNLPLWYYFSCTSLLSCHDLTTFFIPPKNFHSLLGLGLYFCPNPRYSTTNLKPTLLCFRNSLYWQNIIGRPDPFEQDYFDPTFHINAPK